MKKLAVIMPSYNAAAYLRESIDSLLAQDFTDFDLYVFDDCSVDETQSIVQSYTDPRVIYRRNEVNSGISKHSTVHLTLYCQNINSSPGWMQMTGVFRTVSVCRLPI